ncbi:MAG: pentapeptide repeat-containing protein, partial [Symploca sp. SIO1B1]|nr:pentapeptide repeat-containing protein [Symploca sp. SIO1B1]
RVNLTGAILRGVDWTGAKFRETEMTGVSLLENLEFRI